MRKGEGWQYPWPPVKSSNVVDITVTTVRGFLPYIYSIFFPQFYSSHSLFYMLIYPFYYMLLLIFRHGNGTGWGYILSFLSPILIYLSVTLPIPTGMEIESHPRSQWIRVFLPHPVPAVNQFF